MTLIIFSKVKLQLNYKSSINNVDENEHFVKRCRSKIGDVNSRVYDIQNIGMMRNLKLQ